jgi:hypothetical protein
LVACKRLQEEPFGFVPDGAIAERTKLTLSEVRECLRSLENQGYVSVVKLNEGFEAQIEPEGNIYLSQHRDDLDISDSLAAGLIQGWSWGNLVPRCVGLARELAYHKVTVGSIAFAGGFTLLAVSLIAVALRPAKAERPPELIPIESIVPIMDRQPYDPVGESEENSAASPQKRMLPITSLCQSLISDPNEKKWSAVVAIRSVKFEKPYQQFDAWTLCVRASSDDLDQNNEPAPNCFEILVTQEQNTTVLRSLEVSDPIPLVGTPRYRKFRYTVPESKAGDQLFVIIGLSNASYAASKNDTDRSSSKLQTFAIKTKE